MSQNKNIDSLDDMFRVQTESKQQRKRYSEYWYKRKSKNNNVMFYINYDLQQPTDEWRLCLLRGKYSAKTELKRNHLEVVATV